jgi:hypothetical protein
MQAVESFFIMKVPAEQVVEMIVPMCCTKCEEKVKESLLEMEGELFCCISVELS